MKLYAIKNDDGLYLKFDEYGDSDWYLLPDTWSDKSKADSYANDFHGHVVELFEAPAKVVVSADEAEMLAQAKCDDDPAELIVGFVNSRDNYDDDRKAEDRLMRAYVNGYTVAKEKKYNVKVPHAVNSYFKKIDANYCIAGDTFYVDLDEDLAQFTEAEINHYGFQDCEKEEVTDDDR